MLIAMTEENWTFMLMVFNAARSRRGESGRDDRKCHRQMIRFRACLTYSRMGLDGFPPVYHGLDYQWAWRDVQFIVQGFISSKSIKI